MLLTRKAMEEIYEVAKVIYDTRSVSSINEMMFDKDVLNKLPHASSILHKLANQYEVIYLIMTPYEHDDDGQTYEGLNAEEIAIRRGEDPTDPQVINYIHATVLSYALATEPTFEEFMTILEKGLVDGAILSDEDLTVQPKHRIAELSFTSISVPTVTIFNEVYHYASMQHTSMAYKIISYCLENHPDDEVSLDTLLSDMPESAGLKNINEAIRKSTLFSEAGSLDVFITSAARAITVTPRIILSKKGMNHVRKQSNEYLQFLKSLQD
jgi:hypothetical protein